MPDGEQAQEPAPGPPQHVEQVVPEQAQEPEPVPVRGLALGGTE